MPSVIRPRRDRSIGAAAMSRMPEALLSLAAWPAVYGLVFITRSAGFAFNEVVVALVDRPDGRAVLRRFGRVIAVATMAVLALLAATPLGTLWFAEVTGMSPPLAALAVASLAFAVLMPGYAVLQNLYQGMLVRAGRTAAVTEAVVLYLVVCCICLKIGVAAVDAPGIYVTLASFTIAGLLQTAWLAWRSRAV